MPECLPQQPVLKHPQPLFLSHSDRTSFTPIQNNSNIIVIYTVFCCSYIRMSNRKTNILGRMFYCFSAKCINSLPFPEIGFYFAFCIGLGLCVCVCVCVCLCLWFGLFLLLLLSALSYHSFSSLCYTNNNNNNNNNSNKPSHHELVIYLFFRTIITFYFPWQASGGSHSFRFRSVSHTRTHAAASTLFLLFIMPIRVSSGQQSAPLQYRPFSYQSKYFMWPASCHANWRSAWGREYSRVLHAAVDLVPSFPHVGLGV
jgi:hypothetical protein